MTIEDLIHMIHQTHLFKNHGISVSLFSPPTGTISYRVLITLLDDCVTLIGPSVEYLDQQFRFVLDQRHQKAKSKAK